MRPTVEVLRLTVRLPRVCRRCVHGSRQAGKQLAITFAEHGVSADEAPAFCNLEQISELAFGWPLSKKDQKEQKKVLGTQQEMILIVLLAFVKINKRTTDRAQRSGATPPSSHFTRC